MAVTVDSSGDVTVNNIYVGNIRDDPSLRLMSEAQLLEIVGLPGAAPVSSGGISQFLVEDPWEAQDAPGGPVRDPLSPHDPDPDWHPEPHDDLYQSGFTNLINTITQPLIDTFPDWESRSDPAPHDWVELQTTNLPSIEGGSNMPQGIGYDSSMTDAGMVNKAIVAFAKAGAITDVGNPLLGVVGSVVQNAMKRMGIGSDWAFNYFVGNPNADILGRQVTQAVEAGYLGTPDTLSGGAIIAGQTIVMNPDSRFMKMRWVGPKRKAAAKRAPARRTYRRYKR